MHSPESQAIFEQMLDEIDALYRNSKHFHNRLYYSLIATPLAPGRPLLIGINWGGSGEGYAAQQKDYFATYPDALAEVNTYIFIKRSRDFARRIGLDFTQPFNYSNLCFFRTRTAAELPATDFEVCAPIVQRLVDHINPPYILSLGTTLLPYLPAGESETDTTEGRARVVGRRSFGRPHVLLPHPNAKLSNAARAGAWDRAAAYLHRAGV